MRWNKKEKVNIDDDCYDLSSKIFKKFLFLPRKLLNNETRWLETSYIVCVYSRDEDMWNEVRFATDIEVQETIESTYSKIKCSELMKFRDKLYRMFNIKDFKIIEPCKECGYHHSPLQDNEKCNLKDRILNELTGGKIKL